MTKKLIVAIAFATFSLACKSSAPPASPPTPVAAAECGTPPCAKGCKEVAGTCRRHLGATIGDGGLKLSSDNEAAIGSDILKCLHFSGQFVYASFRPAVERSDGISEAEGTINWKGGVLGTPYRTEVAVQLRRVSGVQEFRVRVMSDSAIVPYDKGCRYLSWTSD